MKIIKTIICILLSTFAMFTLYGLFMLSNINLFFTTDNIKNAVSDIDVIHEIDKIKNSSATAGGKTDISNVIDTAYTEAENHGIDKALVDEVFNSKEVKQFLGATVGNTTDYIINGNEGKTVTSEDFNKLLDDNMDTWIDKSGMEISDSKKEVLLIRMKEASKGIIDNLPNTQMVDNAVDKDNLNQIRFLFSKEVKTALVVLTAISLLIILFLKRKENKWLIYIAMTILLAGLITVATSFVMNDILTFTFKDYNLAFLINKFSDNFSQKVLTTGTISSIIGGILFITYFILDKINQRKLKQA